MYLGRIVGRVVATRRIEGLEGEKLLLLQPLDERLHPSRPPEVAVDVVQSGPGDLVLVVDGREASMALDESFVPVDAAVVGHVEEVEVLDDDGGGGGGGGELARPPGMARRPRKRRRGEG